MARYQQRLPAKAGAQDHQITCETALAVVAVLRALL